MRRIFQQFQQFRVRLTNYYEAKQHRKGFEFWVCSAAAGVGVFSIYDMKDALKREKIMLHSLQYKIDLLYASQFDKEELENLKAADEEVLKKRTRVK